MVNPILQMLSMSFSIEVMAIRVLEEHTLDTLFDPADSECCVCYVKLKYPIASVGCGRCNSEVCETCFYKIDECHIIYVGFNMIKLSSFY